jgi:hypothetical protein
MCQQWRIIICRSSAYRICTGCDRVIESQPVYLRQFPQDGRDTKNIDQSSAEGPLHVMTLDGLTMKQTVNNRSSESSRAIDSLTAPL